MKNKRLHLNDLKSEKTHITFIQCINYTAIKGKARGTLCSWFFENRSLKKTEVRIGVILLMDDLSTTIASVTNPTCFFERTEGTVRKYFNSVRNIPHELVFSGEVKIFILNQLNGYPPYALSIEKFSNIVSKCDGCINCSPVGPDVFEYKFAMKGDTLVKKVIEAHHNIETNLPPRKNDRINQKQV